MKTSTAILTLRLLQYFDKHSQRPIKRFYSSKTNSYYEIRQRRRILKPPEKEGQLKKSQIREAIRKVSEKRKVDKQIKKDFEELAEEFEQVERELEEARRPKKFDGIIGEVDEK